VKRSSVTFLFSCLYASLAIAGVKTDLQKDDLTGPAQTVRIETARFSNRSGQWVEGPRELSASVIYNVRGNKTEVIGSVFVGKTLYTYDLQGKLIETVSYNSDNSLLSKTVYTYADTGNLVEMVSYNADGSLDSKTEYTYDDAGRLTEAVSSASFGLLSRIRYVYDDQGHLLEELFEHSRLIHTYDIQGNRIRTVSYDAHDPGLGIEKTVETYDANGNILELTTYYTEKVGEEEGKPIPPPSKRIYTYEWDARSNWVKQTQTSCTAETGKPVCEPSLVTYRTITYYPKTSGR